MIPEKNDFGNPQVSVVALRPNKRPGNLKVFAQVRVGPFEIHGLKIVQQPGQRAYVQWPQVESADEWFPVLSCTDANLKSAVNAAVLDAWQNGGAK